MLNVVNDSRGLLRNVIISDCCHEVDKEFLDLALLVLKLAIFLIEVVDGQYIILSKDFAIIELSVLGNHGNIKMMLSQINEDLRDLRLDLILICEELLSIFDISQSLNYILSLLLNIILKLLLFHLRSE